MRWPDNLPAFCRVHRNGRPLIGMNAGPVSATPTCPDPTIAIFGLAAAESATVDHPSDWAAASAVNG